MAPGHIDDPLEASFEAWPEEEKEPREGALAALGLLSDVAGVFAGVREHFRISRRFARLNYLLNGVRLKFAALEGRIAAQDAQLAEVRSKIASLEFRQAAEVAAEEAVRAVTREKIDEFSSILVGSVDPDLVSDSPADAASLIRDVARLSQMDLIVLRHLEEAFASLFPVYPNMQDPNAFTEKFQDFKDAVRRSGLHPEEFQSECERLRGFGLAAEVLRNTSRMAPSDYCYRPTRRGLKLLRLLGQSSTNGDATSRAERSSVAADAPSPESPIRAVARRLNMEIDAVIKSIDYWTGKVGNLRVPGQIPPTNGLDFADAAANLDRAQQLPGEIAESLAAGYEKFRQAKNEIEHAREHKPGLHSQAANPMPYLMEARTFFMEAKKKVLGLIK